MNEMIKCPECEHELPEDDLQGQVEHMEQNHPEVIEKRLKRERLWNWRKNEPMYPKPSDPLIRR